MESRAKSLKSKKNKNVVINVIPGHFATNHSHVNYYIDMTGVKCTNKMAVEAAHTLAKKYVNNVSIDTIVCMDGCEVVGAYLAQELTSSGINSMNKDASINIVTPEYNTNGQMIFRDNTSPMIWNKNVLLLIASATTGKTINKAMECINYYGGKIAQISALFSATKSINGVEIDSVFDTDDVSDYKTFPQKDCPDCAAGKRIDAIVNSFGYSKF